MTLLRPIAWLMLLGAEVGAAVPVQLPELGLVGPAYVTAVEACPPIEEGPPGTAVVTGTFVTERAPLIHLYIDGLDRPIGVTPSHPLYSEDRAAWVGAGSLRAGERVRTTDGLATIDRIETRATPETVYNLEVRGTHTFFVSDRHLWVHNPCDANKLNHIFGNPKHNLSPLERAFGGNRAAAFDAVEAAANASARRLSNGVRTITVVVKGLRVTVKGLIENGIMKIGSFWM